MDHENCHMHFVLVSNGAQLTCCDMLERGCSALLHALRHLHNELPPLSCCASSQVILKRQFITKYQAPVLKECLHFFNGFVWIFFFFIWLYHPIPPVLSWTVSLM